MRRRNDIMFLKLVKNSNKRNSKKMKLRQGEEHGERRKKTENFKENN